MKRHIIAAVIAVAALCHIAEAREAKPSGTVEYARKDSSILLLDIYYASEGSETVVNGHAKPTVLFMFGGGFKEGERDSRSLRWWFGDLCDAGYNVVSIDYRLGLKGFHGAGMNIKFLKATKRAIDMAVEDLFSATAYLIEHGKELGIDPCNIVVAGSSAGAISVMQAEYGICNSIEAASVLPDGFNYAGVVSFSGAVYSFKGRPEYGSTPCPILMFHGTEDRMVQYDKIKVFSFFFGGAKPIARALAGIDANYSVYRFLGNGHEIAASMSANTRRMEDFILHNVMEGEKVIVDATLKDPEIPVFSWGASGYRSIYNGN